MHRKKDASFFVIYFCGIVKNHYLCIEYKKRIDIMALYIFFLA